MKKSMLFVLTMLIGIGLLASDASQVEDKTIDINFQISYTTPYGVQKKSESGRPMVDKDGNPVIVFVMKKTTEYPILRVETKNGSTTAYWLSLSENGSLVRHKYNGRQSFAALPIASTEKYFNRPSDNGRRGSISLEYIVDRGLGLAPAKCIVAGYFAVTGDPDVRINSSSFYGTVVGFGENDMQAVGIKETAKEQPQEAPKTRSESVATQTPKCTCTCSEDCPCRAVCIAYHNQQNQQKQQNPVVTPDEPTEEVVEDDTPTIPLPSGVVRLPVYGSFNAFYHDKAGSITYVKSILEKGITVQK